MHTSGLPFLSLIENQIMLIRSFKTPWTTGGFGLLQRNTRLPRTIYLPYGKHTWNVHPVLYQSSLETWSLANFVSLTLRILNSFSLVSNYPTIIPHQIAPILLYRKPYVIYVHQSYADDCPWIYNQTQTLQSINHLKIILNSSWM